MIAIAVAVGAADAVAPVAPVAPVAVVVFASAVEIDTGAIMLSESFSV